MFSATVKSHSSNWLHRLWLSKGFSPCTDLDLDQFITSLRHDSYETVHPTSPQNPLPMNAQQTSNIQALDGFTRITNLLSDLFCVGDPIPNSFPGRKCPRKQPNPRHHLVSKSSDESLSTMSDHNSGVGLLKEMTLQDDQVKLVENIKCTDEEEDGYLSLDGFSITEVTVIDTSFAGWKFEKMLFRKNDTWKATDKKGKATVTLGKKKKKRRNALVMAKEKSQRKNLKVLPLGSSMLKKGGSGCNEEENARLIFKKAFKMIKLLNIWEQVCCIITNDVWGDQVVREGYLYAEGTTCAESQAVEAAGERCKGATAYLNMELGDCYTQWSLLLLRLSLHMVAVDNRHIVTIKVAMVIATAAGIVMVLHVILNLEVDKEKRKKGRRNG